MAKSKATHYGECQICGSQQKLPSGLLSKHGYTVRWGFFAGVCQGADSLPFEQSCDLIKQGIAYAEERKVDTLAEIEKLNQPATEPKAWYHQYVPAQYYGGVGMKSYYKWIQVDVYLNDRGYATFNTEDGKPNRIAGLPYTQDLLELATYLNKLRAKSLEGTVRQLNEYIEWQNDRIKNWEPKELTPVSGRKVETTNA